MIICLKFTPGEPQAIEVAYIDVSKARNNLVWGGYKYVLFTVALLSTWIVAEIGTIGI